MTNSTEACGLPDVEAWILEVLARLPASEVVPYPDWGSQTFRVGGKHFGRVGEHPSGARIMTVKGDPDVNAALVGRFAAIAPGYYADKRRWISLEIDDPTLPREVAIQALETAYALVRQGLPKRVQVELG